MTGSRLEIEMFQLVIVDNSGYESEIVAVLPHQYATAAAGRADRDVMELHKPSDRYASWQVWSTDRIAGRDDTAPSAAVTTLATIQQPGDPKERQ